MLLLIRLRPPHFLENVLLHIEWVIEEFMIDLLPEHLVLCFSDVLLPERHILVRPRFTFFKDAISIAFLTIL